MSSGVKTDWNCLRRILALPKLSLTRFVPSFSGATPMLSCLLFLMYCQNGLLLFSWSPSSIVVLMWFHSALRMFRLHSFWKCL